MSADDEEELLQHDDQADIDEALDEEIENDNIVTNVKGGSDATFYGRNVCFLNKDNNYRKWYRLHLGSGVEKVRITNENNESEIVGIDDPRVPPPAPKTPESLAALYEKVDNIINDNTLSQKIKHSKLVKLGQKQRDVFNKKYKCLDATKQVVNDFMHAEANLIKYIFKYICHYHFNENRKKAFMQENRRFTMNDVEEKDVTHWTYTNEYMKKNVITQTNNHFIVNIISYHYLTLLVIIQFVFVLFIF